ncbi:MAG: HEAT repeat domain-containing protein [Verrucomicrobia bacterium]|nr:HEAT repeat domain-containing protein [Verrucomicrobiota bacterium]
MRVRLLIGFALVFGVPAVIFMVQLRKVREVKVGGKPAVAWALELNGPGDRKPAEEVFRQIGPQAVPNLVEALQSKDSIFKKPLLSVAAHLPDKLRIGLFRTVRPEDAERLRLGAATALAIMGAKATSAIPVLGQALYDANHGVSMQSAIALGKTGRPGVRALVTALKEGQNQTRLLAMYGLGIAGAEADAAVPALIEALADKNLQIRESAFQTLSHIRHPATVAAILPKLNHGDPSIRLNAAKCLGSMGPWARDAIPALIDAIKEESSAVRASAVEALGRIRPSAEDVIAALTNALADPDPAVRANAAGSLGNGGSASAVAVPRLIERLKDADAGVRGAAALALGAIGPKASAATGPLKELAKDADGQIRVKAQQALDQIDKSLK